MDERRQHLLGIIDEGPKMARSTVERGETAAHLCVYNEEFKYWCKEAGLYPSVRQARAWMNGEGLAYQTMRERATKEV